MPLDADSFQAQPYYLRPQQWSLRRRAVARRPNGLPYRQAVLQVMRLAPVELQQTVRGVRLPGMESRHVRGAEGCRDGCSGELEQPVHNPGSSARKVDSRQCGVEDPVVR